VLLLDNSAWWRAANGIVTGARAKTIAEWFKEREIAVCLPFALEAGYSARSAIDHKTLMDRFEKLPQILIDGDVERLAKQTQRELAAIGHHRLAPADVMIAACAHKAEAGVLHYDKDYDILAEKTSLVFESEWLAPRGTL
jgi:predicted nucleic acid-binding protein